MFKERLFKFGLVLGFLFPIWLSLVGCDDQTLMDDETLVGLMEENATINDTAARRFQKNGLEIRVKNEFERKRMQEMVDNHVDKDAIVSTYTNSAGQIVDCVERERQPSLLNPKMKGHVIEDPPEIPAPMFEENDNRDGTEAPAIEEEGGCEEGTVPIVRLTMERLERFESIEDYNHKDPSSLSSSNNGLEQPSSEPFAFATEGHNHAAAYIHPAPPPGGGPLWSVDGFSARLSIWKPAYENSPEFSLGQIWVVGGSKATGTCETVEAGWIVRRSYHGDDLPHLFIFFTTNCYDESGPDKGGWNLDVKGFIQTDHSVEIGGPITPYSIKNGTQIWKTFQWRQKRAGWWLYYDGKWVGYYPRELFNSGLENSATWVQVGGEIYTDNAQGSRFTYTDMGSGSYYSTATSTNQYNNDVAAAQKIFYLDSDTGAWVRPTSMAVKELNHCYEGHFGGGASDPWGAYFFYGGTGYNTMCKYQQFN
jgi:hypothetical protein